MVGPNGAVFAFEPQPTLFQFLCTNLTLNGIETVAARPEALSSKAGVITMAPLPPSDTFFNYGAVPLASRFGSPVASTTIDALNLESCSLIKADVEGMEPDVIRGAVETIAKHKPVLYLEHNGDDSSQIASALDEIGYKAFWSFGAYFNPRNFYANPTNIWPNVMPSVNLLAIPQESSQQFSGQEFLGAKDNWKSAINRRPTT